jgi:transposase
MPQFAPRAGIDCSAERLDVHIHPCASVFAVDHAPQGWRALDRRLAEAGVEIVALEASGGLEREVAHFLIERGYAVHLLDPYRVRQFAKAAGALAKNDRIDAALIARFVVSMPSRPMVRRKAIETLAELVNARAQLIEQITATRNQQRWHRDPLLGRLDQRRAAHLEADIATLDRRIGELIGADPDLLAKNAILRSMKGVGPVLAHTLIALLPELGQLSRKQIAALVGVAPFEDQSGKRQGIRFIQGGRARIRAPLYMAALVAGVRNPILKACRERLRARGKKPKVAIVALMRRMITILNAMLRDNKPWTPQSI